MADKIKKNLLGRTVTVERKVMSDGSLAKTRTVKSKSGGTIRSNTSYKDAGSVVGKMRAKKIDAAPVLATRDVKKTVVKNPYRNSKLNASEEMAQLKASRGIAGASRGAMNAGKVVKRVKSDSKPLMKKAVKEGPVRPIGETVKRVKMDSKPINNSYKMSASDSAKKYTQSEINKFIKKKP